MTIKEKMLKIIALAMSIKATDSLYLSICWNNEANNVDIYVHEHINGESQRVAVSYTYDGGASSSYGSYLSYDDMIGWLERMKKDWGEV